MPSLYRYKARDRAGAEITGEISGETPEAVSTHLESLDLIPIKVSRKGTGFSIASPFGPRKVSHEDLIVITRNLATLYRAGIPLLRSLDIMAEQYADSPIGTALTAVRSNVERGEQLSEAMAQYPHVFSAIFVASIRAAEISGKLDVVLEHLAKATEREMVTNEEIKKAIRYPVMVVAAIGIAFAVLMVFVVPKFADFYSTQGASLPYPTRVLISLSDFIQNSWFLLVPGLIAFGVLSVKLVKHPTLKPIVDRLILNLPVMGNLITKIYFSRFSHLLSVLVVSGAPLLKSLAIVRKAIGNSVLAGEISQFALGLREGRQIAESKHLMPHFPKLVVSLMQIGLESGSLELTLEEISRFFDREVHYTSQRLTSMLEPVLVVVIGAMVLFMALAIFLPMWNLVSVFKQ